MLGGMSFPMGRITYDFNWTFVRNESEIRNIGLLVVHSRQAKIREMKIHDDIAIVLEEGIYHTQNA